MWLSRIGLPSFTDWNTKSSGPRDFTARKRRMAKPALTSTVNVRNRFMRSITFPLTGMVVFEASLFGSPQSPRQYRSSIVIDRRGYRPSAARLTH